MHEAIDQLMVTFVELVREITGMKFEGAHTFEVATYLKERKDVQGRIYDEIRRSPSVAQFSQLLGVVEPVKQLPESNIAIIRNIPFGIDVPLDTTEYAVWHQDYYYVRGILISSRHGCQCKTQRISMAVRD